MLIGDQFSSLGQLNMINGILLETPCGNMCYCGSNYKGNQQHVPAGKQLVGKMYGILHKCCRKCRKQPDDKTK